MADKSIRQDFLEGIQEIFTTLINNGDEETDGVFLYLLSEKNTTNRTYKESKYKTYQKPVLLVCKAEIAPTHGEETVEEVKDRAEFTVTYPSMIEHGLSVTHEALEEMRRGVMKFHDTWYVIDNIIPKAYVEDVFLMYRFQCTEDKVFDEEAIIIEDDEDTEEGDTT